MHGWYILRQRAKRNESYARVADISERYVMMTVFYLTPIYTSVMEKTLIGEGIIGVS